MKNTLRCAMACAGAVIGAGFASGREITGFFSRFGGHSWWLIALAVVVMIVLCQCCMDCGSWQNASAAGRICMFLLLTVAGGAMTSAAGQMIALVWGSEMAYPAAAAGTLMLSWILSSCHTRVFGWLGSVLSLLLAAVLLLCLCCVEKPNGTFVAAVQPGAAALACAAAKAAGYAAMNITLSSGVIWRCAQGDRRADRRSAQWFGAVAGLLLCLSNALYLRHAQLIDTDFPIVGLLRAFGRRGFLLSAALLYLAILTTLVAVTASLRSAVAPLLSGHVMRMIAALGLPLCFSAAGFGRIVDNMYAPAGWLCMLMWHDLQKNRSSHTQEMLDNKRGIQ